MGGHSVDELEKKGYIEIEPDEVASAIRLGFVIQGDWTLYRIWPREEDDIEVVYINKYHMWYYQNRLANIDVMEGTMSMEDAIPTMSEWNAHHQHVS